jgi:protein-S-isoprenylcysteine O-methyltransferase Ste14
MGKEPKRPWYSIRRKRSRARILFILLGLVFQQATPITLAVGGGVLVLARALQIWSYGHLDKASRTNPHRPDAVTTSGPYAFVRNPIMLGSSFSDVGFLVMAGNPIVLGLYVFLILPLHALRVTRMEEPHLLKEYGEAYEAYTRKVPRFLPRLLPHPDRERRPFSLLLAIRNREMSRSFNYLFLGWVLVLVAGLGQAPYPDHLMALPPLVPWAIVAAGLTGVLALTCSTVQYLQARTDAEAGDLRVRRKLREKVTAGD